MALEIFLRSCEMRHPDILLKHGQPQYLGRGKLCDLKENRFSRTLLQVTANYDRCIAIVEQQGPGTTCVRKQTLQIGQQIEMQNEDTLEMFEFGYKLIVNMNNAPAVMNSNTEQQGQQASSSNLDAKIQVVGMNYYPNRKEVNDGCMLEIVRDLTWSATSLNVKLCSGDVIGKVSVRDEKRVIEKIKSGQSLAVAVGNRYGTAKGVAIDIELLEN